MKRGAVDGSQYSELVALLLGCAAMWLVAELVGHEPGGRGAAGQFWIPGSMGPGCGGVCGVSTLVP